MRPKLTSKVVLSSFLIKPLHYVFLFFNAKAEISSQNWFILLLAKKSLLPKVVANPTKLVPKMTSDFFQNLLLKFFLVLYNMRWSLIFWRAVYLSLLKILSFPNLGQSITKLFLESRNLLIRFFSFFSIAFLDSYYSKFVEDSH